MAPEPLRPRPLVPRNVSNSTKVSLRSHSSSFEADDERSSSTDLLSMGPERPESPLGRDGIVDTAPHYPGEDTRLTSKKELAGWYAYGFAAEVFIICGMGSFIPMTLEQLARENGYLLTDRSKPCLSTSNRSSSAMALMSRLVESRAAEPDDGQCIITILGMEINSASFAMYTFSASVLVQSILVISISCAADHGNYRKRLLLTFAFIGATATMLFITALPSVYLLGALYAIIANTCSGASFVLLNSFLPLLVRHHPESQMAAQRAASLQARETEFPDSQVDTDTTLAGSATALLPDPDVLLSRPSTSIELQLSTQISAKGIGIAYTAGLFLQCLSIVVILLLKSSTFSLRLVLFLIGLWWFVFTIPAAMWLRPRPGPPLPKHPSSTGAASSPSKARTWLGYIGHSWLSLYRTITFARRLTDIVLFLASWFLLSDAIATVSGVSILFAKTHLHMAPPALALISVLATTSGILGAFTWPLISRYFSLNPVHTILCCIALFELIPLYGLLDYLPFIHSLGFFGLQQPWEMYPVGILYGFVLGGLSSYCRSLYGELIPPGSEAAFYALYAITDKGSSIFGPAIVGIIVDRTGGIRPAFWFLMLLIGLPAPLVAFVNVERGRREGRALSGVIDGFRAAREAGSGFPSAVASGTASLTEVGVGNEETRGLLTGQDDEHLRGA